MCLQPGTPFPVPVGIPVEAPAGEEQNIEPALLALRHEQGYPVGLASALRESVESTPLRFMICDNSFSMQAGDGRRFAGGQLISCTRADECLETIFSHAMLSSGLSARSDYYFLNATGRGQAVTLRGITSLRVGDAHVAGDIAAVRPLLTKLIEPCGGTPLTASVRAVRGRIEPVADQLRRAGHVATVVLATDGVPDDPVSFFVEMKELQRLPVWVIVRLCTSASSIVDYWAELDKQLEQPLEVLDDLEGEARDIAAKNSWLTYAPQLHAARLFGLRDKLFDLMDEVPFTPTQVKALCERLLGECELPEPELDAAAFLHALQAALARAPPVYNPLTRKMTPWIDVPALARKLFAWKHLGACGRCVFA